MSSFRDFLRKRNTIGQMIKAFSFFDNDDYVRLEDHKDTVLTRASYPELSAAYPTGRYGQAQRQELNNPIPANTWEQFGQQVAMSGDGQVMVTSSPGYDGTGSNAGKAMIYRWNGTIWVLEYAGNYGSASQEIGIKVAINSDGDRVAITRLKTVSGQLGAGSVRILRYDTGSWQWDTDIDHPGPTVANERFGWDIAFDKQANTLAIGAYQAFDTNSTNGKLWIYHRSGTTWSLKQTIASPTKLVNQFFAKTLKLSADGNTLVVSAEGLTSNGTGTNGVVYIYVRAHNSNLFYVNQSLAPPRELSAIGNYYGSRQVGMSEDGSVIAIGCRYATRYSSSLRDGAVIVYKRSRNAINSHANQNPIAADTYSSKDQRNRYPFGQYNIHQMIGGPRYNDTTEQFGNTVTISGDGSTLLMGGYAPDAYYDETLGKYVSVGGVLVYKLDENAEGSEKGVYKKHEFIMPPLNHVSNYMYFGHAGHAIDYTGDRFLIGMDTYDGGFTNEGIIYSYSYIDDSATDLRFPQQRYGKSDICNFVKVK